MRHVILGLTALFFFCSPTYAGIGKVDRSLNSPSSTSVEYVRKKKTPSGSTARKQPQKGKKFKASKRVHSVKKEKTRQAKATFGTYPEARASSLGGSSRAIQEARKYLGGKPKGMMKRLWCAQFMNYIEKKVGRPGTGSNFARSYASSKHYKRVSSPRPGDIVVLSRGKRGGHVGYVTSVGRGYVHAVSGNSRGGKVSEGRYSAKRVVAYVRPV